MYPESEASSETGRMDGFVGWLEALCFFVAGWYVRCRLSIVLIISM